MANIMIENMSTYLSRLAFLKISFDCQLKLKSTKTYQGIFGSALVRCYTTDSSDLNPVVRSMVRVNLESRPLNLTSSIIYVFTSTRSVVPHFTLDLTCRGNEYGFYSDLIPKATKANYASESAYFDKVYAPLLYRIKDHLDLSELRECSLSDAHEELISPVAMAFTTRRVEALRPLVEEYLGHWLKVVDENKELTDTTFPSSQLEVEELDLSKRRAIFSPRVDKIWPFLWFILGYRRAEEIRHLLIGEV